MRRAAPLFPLTLLLLLTPHPAAAAPPANLRRTPAVDVFERNRDAVVNVNTTTVVRQRFGAWSDDPFFERFFGRPFERDVTRRSLGSGFIIHRDGYIVTNAHVVQGADAVQVNLADGATLDAAVLAADADHDLAILKIDPPPGRTLATVTLGDSADLMQGEPAIAIGNPLGYHHSVSAGIVSATDRRMQFDADHALADLIQTDTSINPGNSGGPLLNAYGQVIGINTAVRGDAQNIGFAIPVNQLRDLLTELLSPLALRKVDLAGTLRETRTVRPPADVTATLHWIAADAATEPFEVTAIHGTPVRDIVDAAVALLHVTPGDRVVLTGPRGELALTAQTPRLGDAARLAGQVMGLTPRPLSPADRARLQVGGTRGLVIDAVERGGPADAAGLRPGDVLVQLGRHPVESLEDLAALLADAPHGALADVIILRDGRLGRARMKLRGAI